MTQPLNFVETAERWTVYRVAKVLFGDFGRPGIYIMMGDLNLRLYPFHAST